MNLIDRAISVFFPRAALRRSQARIQYEFLAGSGYTGASGLRRSMQAWWPLAGDSDRDTIPDLPTLRARSRDLYRNAPLATGALDTAAVNVVGPGLKLQSRIDREFLGMADEEADAWERTVEREFALWADSPESDATRTESFYSLQGLAFLSTMMSGDVFAVLPMIPRPGQPYDLRIQLVEADRVKNPDGRLDDDKVAGGVEVDTWGAPVAYHIANRHPGAFGLNDGYKRVPPPPPPPSFRRTDRPAQRPAPLRTHPAGPKTGRALPGPGDRVPQATEPLFRSRANGGRGFGHVHGFH